jgi:hypothetical protein
MFVVILQELSPGYFRTFPSLRQNLDGCKFEEERDAGTVLVKFQITQESRWGARFSAPVQTGPGAHPASCIMGTGSFPEVESGRGVTLTPHPLLVPRSKKQSRATPLLSQRAFVAYKRVKPT